MWRGLVCSGNGVDCEHVLCAASLLCCGMYCCQLTTISAIVSTTVFSINSAKVLLYATETHRRVAKYPLSRCLTG